MLHVEAEGRRASDAGGERMLIWKWCVSLCFGRGKPASRSNVIGWSGGGRLCCWGASIQIADGTDDWCANKHLWTRGEKTWKSSWRESSRVYTDDILFIPAIPWKYSLAHLIYYCSDSGSDFDLFLLDERQKKKRKISDITHTIYSIMFLPGATTPEPGGQVLCVMQNSTTRWKPGAHSQSWSWVLLHWCLTSWRSLHTFTQQTHAQTDTQMSLSAKTCPRDAFHAQKVDFSARFLQDRASVSPRCSICTSLPSASSLRSGPVGRRGTPWECPWCSVASRPCQEDTGRTSGHQRSRGHGTGTLAVRPALGRPRIERLWRAAKQSRREERGGEREDNAESHFESCAKQRWQIL